MLIPYASGFTVAALDVFRHRLRTESKQAMGHSNMERPVFGEPHHEPEDWHTLTLDVMGHIISGDQDLANLLGPQAGVLAGRAVKTVIPDIPFSAKTPGYNLAYAIVHGANGAEVRRTARSADGRGILVDTVLSNRNTQGIRNITLKLRPTFVLADGTLPPVSSGLTKGR